MSTPTAAEPEKEKAPRKFPAPCWTQDEALCLIEAYRERWYALRRGYLRTADWDAVAASVGERCPDSSPPKTSAQCRHKMEKLRQRYRAEKQRSLSFPGKFFSTWFFFDNMDAMELGTTPGDRSNQPTVNQTDSGRKPKKGKKIGAIPNPNPNPNHVPDLDSGEFQSNAIVVRNSSYTRPKSSTKTDPYYGSRVSNGNPMYMDIESDQNEDSDDEEDDDEDDDDVGYRTRAQIDANLAPPVLRAKKMGKGHGNFGGHNHVDQEMTHPGGYRSNRSSKLNPNFGGVDVRFDPKMQRFRTKGSVSNDRYSSPNPPNPDSRSGYGFPSGFGSGVGKKRGGDKGVKRDRGEGLGEIVSSIKMLGDGFMKMETMKIEMAREIEKMRMEMETKRNEMILESQRQIVDAFMSVLVDNKKSKKANPEVPLDS